MPSEAELAPRDVVGDSDGDGTCVGNVGLNGAVGSNDLEHRDRVEGEGSRPNYGEIVHRGHYYEVRVNWGRERSL